MSDSVAGVLSGLLMAGTTDYAASVPTELSVITGMVAAWLVVSYRIHRKRNRNERILKEQSI